MRRVRRARWFWRWLGRPAILLVLILVGMAAMIQLWPRKVSGMAEDRWNQIKVDWRAEADVLIVGDSRGASALLPRVMAEGLPDRRIKNFSFPGTAYLPGYVEAGLLALDPRSPHRTVIFTFSSKTLTTNREGWPPVMERSWSTVWKWKHIPGLMEAFEPIGKWDFINTVRGQPRLGLWREFRDDGSYVGGGNWGKRVPTLEDAKAMLGKYKVDASIVAGVMEDVRTLSASGVRVLGVRTPSTLPVEALEEELLGWDLAGFVRDFEAAGGEWIEVPERGSYTTYDQIHLVVPEAERFSRWFTRRMQAPRALGATGTSTAAVGTSTAAVGTSTSAR